MVRGNLNHSPVPVLAGDVTDEPRDALSLSMGQSPHGTLRDCGLRLGLVSLTMEDNLFTDAALDEPVGEDEITVELETGIVEDKVDTAALKVEHVVGEIVQVVAKNVLLSGGKVLSAGRLELLDVLLGHVDKEGQIGRVTPETN
jgi:hypothetical protein